MTKEKVRRPQLIDRATKASVGARPIPPGSACRPPSIAAGGSIAPVFFDLLILEVQKGKPRDQWPHVQELVQGRTYKLFLVGSPDGTTLEENKRPQGIKIINQTIQLQLQWPAEIQNGSRKPLQELTLSYSEAKNLERGFVFSLSSGVPSGPVYFELKYRHTGQTLYQPLGNRHASIQGNYNLVNQSICEKCQIEGGLPLGVALLVVDFTREPSPREQRYELSLYGWTRQGRLLDARGTLEMLVSVAQLVQRDKKEQRITDPESIISTIMRFSRKFSDGLLTQWLRELREQSIQEEPPCLIIVDHTSLRPEVQLEIPWEMLELQAGTYQFLGAVMQVVRWLPFRHDCQLEVKKVYHTGALLSYLDPDLGSAKIQAERTILACLGSQVYESLPDLELRMRLSLQNVGFVHIGCHGLNGNELFTRAWIQRPSDRLSAINLALLHPPPDRPKPSFTVFLNACESVRITGNYNAGRGSFVEGFLTNGARGFIGTLASVDVQTASENAQFILERLTSGENIRIAEALRLLRVKAVNYLQDTLLLPGSEKKKELVYKMLDSFMYVYYGDPLAHLHLQAAETQQGTLFPSHACTISAGQHEKEEA